MPVVADMIDVHDESASSCVRVGFISTVCVIVYMHPFAYMSACAPAAGGLYIRHSQQHDASGGACPVDGAE